jgi:hypothetical protein
VGRKNCGKKCEISEFEGKWGVFCAGCGFRWGIMRIGDVVEME